MIRRAVPWLLIHLAAFTFAREVDSQEPSELRLEAGFAHVRQSSEIDETRESVFDAGLFAVFWRRPAEKWTLLASGNLTYGADSVAAAQGVAALSIPWTLDDRLRTETGVAGARFALSSAGRGGNANVFARQHFITNNGGAWAGAGVARTSRDGASSTSAVQDIGVWGRLGFLYGSGSFAWQQSDDWPLLRTAGAPIDASADRYILRDLELVLEARGGPNSIAVAWAARRGLSGTTQRVEAVSASGILQISDRVALTASAGRQFADPVRGLPQAELFTASLRLSLGSKPLPVMQRSELASAVVEERPGPGGELVVRVFAADTMHIEVAGDFSQWLPLALEREEGFWVARVRLQPGSYRVAVRVNYGPWRAPRNLARVRDDYGGEAGLVVVP